MIIKGLSTGLQKKVIVSNNINIINQNRVFVIAEIGMNHNGDINNAIKLIDDAVECGADSVKFQMRDLDSLYQSEIIENHSGDLGTEYTLGLLNKFNLKYDDFKTIYEYAKMKNIMFLCTPWDKPSVDIINTFDVPFFKIASADLTNMDLLQHVCKYNKPLIISTGMSTEREINMTVEYLKKKNVDFYLLHCNSTYPAPYHAINLSYLNRLKKHGVIVGYSGHERGIAVTLASIALGARIIERHITLDRNMEGPDHTASLEKNDFKELVKGIREIEQSMGEESDRKLSQGELINRENLSKCIYASKDIQQGDEFTKDNLEIKSPGQGISPQYLPDIIGKKSKRNIDAYKPIFKSDYTKIVEPKPSYDFNRKWALPVRYHDINQIFSITSPRMVEFHMSFDDLKLNPDSFLSQKFSCEFLVHAPELFEGDHLLDLCTHDKDYREKSIENLQRVIDTTIQLTDFFENEKHPKIILNCGGFSKDKFLSVEERSSLYDNLAKSIEIFKSHPVELIPQNMAPFPWHFGGQRFQNLFMDVNEIKRFCEENNIKICHDISHSHLTCNHFKWNHIEYIRELGAFTSHFHIADASGVDGEGLQIGQGTVNFDEILPIIDKEIPDISFIPEIWQGHKNNGEGFWIALSNIEGKI